MAEEKLEFLKREDIKTMKKDLSRLREEEARKERERIIKLKLEQEEKKERKERKQKEKTGKEKPKKSLREKIPKISFKKPLIVGKLWARFVISIVILTILVSLFTFGYWYFTRK